MTGRVIPDMMMIEEEEMTAKDQELSIVNDMHLTQILIHAIIGIADQLQDTTETGIVTETDDTGDEAIAEIGANMHSISQKKKMIERTNTKGVKGVVHETGLIRGGKRIAHDLREGGEVIDHPDEVTTQIPQHSNQKKKQSR